MTRMDIILTIAGLCLYIPFIVQCCSTHWDKSSWMKQLLLLLLLLQGTSILHIPSVMYVSSSILAVYVLVYSLFHRQDFRWTPMLTLTMLYIGWFAVSLCWSAVPLKGMLFLMDTGLPMIVFSIMGCAVTITREERISLFRNGCYAGLIFISMTLISWLLCCFQTGTPLNEWPFFAKAMVQDHLTYDWVFRWLGGMEGYTHPSYNLLPLFFIIGAATWLRKKREIKAWVWWTLWAGSVSVTLVSQSRMGILFACIEIIAYIVYIQFTLRRQVFTAVSIAIVGLTVIGLTFSFWTQYGSDSIRDTLHTYTIRYIQAKPWTGAGAGALNPIEMCHTIGVEEWPHIGHIAPDAKVEEWQPKTRMLPHNQWLADWAHAGMVAAVLCMAVYICLIIRCIRMRRVPEGLFLLIFCIFSYLEPPLYIGKGLYLFGLIGAWLYMYREREEQAAGDA